MTATKWLVSTVTLAALGWAVPVGAAWIAYNDSLRQPGDATAQNVTGWTIHNNDQSHFTGRLRDFETGSDAGMPTVTFTMGGAGLSVSSGAAGGNPAPGTDAYEIFGGIVDLGPDVVYYGSRGWWVEIEFTGLVPENTYSFVGTAIRSRDYPERVSLFTILDTPGFVNNSSDGVVEKAGAVTKLLAGDNRATGYVVRWDEIVPSAAGTFKVRAEAAPESADGRAYPFGGFRLEEVGRAGNRPPEVDAGDYAVLLWPVHSLRLKPIVHDDDPCDVGILIYRWSKVSGPGAVRFDPADDVESPTAVFSEPGEYEIRVRVWDELGQEAAATTTITIAQPLLGDFNVDKRVNWVDLVLFAAQWLDPVGSPADLNITHGVDLVDFAIVAENWRIGEGATLVINEIMARNDRAVTDPQGEYEDWIELYNGGEDAIDVGGMYLTDDASEPTRWRVPMGDPVLTTIFPGNYLLIWADRDVTDPGLHAGFEIGADGGEIALFDTDGSTLIDIVAFGGQTPDVSFGREPDASTNLVTLAPTPGASNNGAFLAVVADTQFSHDRGFYSAPFEVIVTSATADAIIRYTTDGSTPGLSHGNVYTAPIPITATTALRAMAFKPGWKSTNVDTHTYIFLDDVNRQATHPTTGAQVTPAGYPTSWGSVTGDYQVDPDVVGQNGTDIFGRLYARTFKDDMKAVPTISLVMDRDDWFGSRGIYINKSQDGTERVASIEYIDPNAETDIQVNCAIAMQGGVSGGGTSLNRWKSLKLSMRPRFKTQTDDGTPTGGPPKLAFKLFADSPVERHNTVVLDAVLNHSWVHGTSAGQRRTAMYVQDQYVADLHNAMGGQSGHGAYAHVYINGLYWGMYYIHERPDHAWAAQVFGGDEDEYDAIKHNPGGVINNGTGGSATANYNAMLAAVNALASDSGNLAKYQAVCDVLDVDNFITYLLANWHPGNHDWPHKNWYATHRNTPDGRWRFHSWDAEHSVEGGNDVGESPSDLHSRLARSAEYRMRFADHIQRHFFNDGVLTYPATADAYALRMSQIDRAIVGESARWGDNRDDRPYTRQDWANTQAGKLTGFFPNRSNEVLGRLKSANLYPSVSPPSFFVNGRPQHGGHVGSGTALVMGLASGTIYYTLDGADPRAPGGAINAAAARPYTGPVTLSQSSVVKARARSGSTWSALNEAVFAVGPVAEGLRISEIMYHPINTGRPDDPNAEYIELTNIGAETIGLNLVRFTNGVDFTFPSFELAPGDYCLVVRDIDAFRAKYGEGPTVVGRYTGSLNNAGERVELQDAAGQVIHRFRFQDDWYDITDGLGFSLTVKAPATVEPAELDGKRAWRPSAAVGGSPGFDDSGQVPEPGAVVVNELLANSGADADWIELHNTTARTIDVGGWFLSDEGDELTKYEIAPGTVIGAGGYLVFSEDRHFGNAGDPGCHDSFALSRDGETVYLHSGADGALGGYSDQEKFDASDPGVSLGRYAKSTGTYNFVALDTPTPGRENATPRVGPVVINEIMYHPNAAGDAEYVELLNIAATAVTLYDAERHAPWRFTDDPDNPGIEFLFPIDPPVALNAGEYLVLAKDLVAFNARFTVPAGVQVFAWGAGNLANGSERVQLSKPGDEETDGTRNWIRIDRVVYSDGTHPAGADPWPTQPDGGGASLTRIDPAAYGNDPVNWTAAAPSPGR